MEVKGRAAYPWCSLTHTKRADKAQEYATVSQSISDIRIVPLPDSRDVLTEICRQGAGTMLAEAIEAEVADWIDAHAHLKDQDGRRQVVRNGSHPERDILTGIGPITVKQPRVLDRRSPEQRERFTPNVLPPYLRRTKNVDEAIPWLYLKGISTSDFPEALQALFGPDAKGLSANTVTRLKAAWRRNTGPGANGP
jgi:putative transposase